MPNTMDYFIKQVQCQAGKGCIPAVDTQYHHTYTSNSFWVYIYSTTHDRMTAGIAAKDWYGRVHHWMPLCFMANQAISTFLNGRRCGAAGWFQCPDNLMKRGEVHDHT